jgi:cytochrome c556
MAKSKWSCMVLLALATALGLVYLVESGLAGDAKKFGADIDKIAASIKSGDKAGAEALAVKTSKKAEELADIMYLFKLRSKGGLGVGPSPQAKSDGIETRLRDIARDAPSNLAKDGPALEQMGYHTAAIALVSKVMAPPKDVAKKKVSDFKRWCDEMYDTGVALAKAAKGGGGQEVKAAAAKVNASCNSCHSVFRE